MPNRTFVSTVMSEQIVYTGSKNKYVRKTNEKSVSCKQ